MKQQSCANCNRTHEGACAPTRRGRHRAPSAIRTLTPTLTAPPVRRPRRSGLAFLESMGFAERTIRVPAPVMEVPPLPPVRLAPAFTPSPGAGRPTPQRPVSKPPTTARRPGGTQALVDSLWNEEAVEEPGRKHRSLPPPTAFALDAPEKSRGGRAGIAAATLVVLFIGTLGLARARAETGAGAARAHAAEVTTTAREVDTELAAAIRFLTDPNATPSNLSAAAGTITRLSAIGIDLAAIGREQPATTFGAIDPITNRAAHLAAGTAGSTLGSQMSSLLTTRLVLEDLITLPSLSVNPDDAGSVGADLAAVVSQATARLADVPESHAAISADALATLQRIDERSSTYAADLRNGEPVGGHLSALESEVEGFQLRLMAYLEAADPTLTASMSAFGDALAALPAG